MSDHPNPQSAIQNPQPRILYLFTRTPLHVGAGASVGAIDQPVQRERHTGFPIIPATSLKGSFADHWNDGLHDEEADKDGKVKRVRVTKEGAVAEAAWLFGSDNDKPAFAGSLLFSEARVLAFPIRSAKGSYAWITCPLMLQRAARDGVFGKSSKIRPTDTETNPLLIAVAALKEPSDEQAIFKTEGPLSLVTKIDNTDTPQVVLEEYCFTYKSPGNADVFGSEGLAEAISKLVADDLFKTVAQRLVILSNGMMSHFATTTCEIAQHVRISDETGTADEGGLFNQENVPADTLFYSVLSATKSRVPNGSLRYEAPKENTPAKNDEAAALTAFEKKVNNGVFQFGGDATTGHGFCTVTLANPPPY